MEEIAKYRCEFRIKRRSTRDDDEVGTSPERNKWYVELVTTMEKSMACPKDAASITRFHNGPVDLRYAEEDAAAGARMEHAEHPSSTFHQEPEEVLRAKQRHPWNIFLPPAETNGWTADSPRHGPAGTDFSQVLNEGKQRLEKARQEGSLRERAEIVGHAGDGLLDDLLADLREPSSSRQQNERLRQGMATHVRARIARLFGRVMCTYFSGPDSSLSSDRRSAMVRATTTFRVKLQRMLNPSNLGEIQNQVARDIAGIRGDRVVRPRACCAHVLGLAAHESPVRRRHVQFRQSSTPRSPRVPVRPKTTSNVSFNKHPSLARPDPHRRSSGNGGHGEQPGSYVKRASMTAPATMGSRRSTNTLGKRVLIERASFADKAAATPTRKVQNCRLHSISVTAGGIYSSAIDVTKIPKRVSLSPREMATYKSGQQKLCERLERLRTLEPDIATDTAHGTLPAPLESSIEPTGRPETTSSSASTASKSSMWDEVGAAGVFRGSHGKHERPEEDDTGSSISERDTFEDWDYDGVSSSPSSCFHVSSDEALIEHYTSTSGPGSGKIPMVDELGKERPTDSKANTAELLVPGGPTVSANHIPTAPSTETRGKHGGASKRRHRSRCRKTQGRGGDAPAKKVGARRALNLSSTAVSALDEACSNRSLTVLLTELGLYQSFQRTKLTHHLPENLKDDAELEKMTSMPLPPRVDRPHFSPAFVELVGTGKGPTLLMCPEPVAPGYECTDVFEEVVKMHPPVGQFMLEDIVRGDISTPSEALAHAAYFEQTSTANQSQLLMEEFLSDSEVAAILASAEHVDVDLAQCVETGTLFDDDVP